MTVKKKWYYSFSFGCLYLFLTAFNINSITQNGTEPWNAPAGADTLKSPFSFSAEVSKKGEELYNLYCWSCHGDKGLGDGAAGANLVIKPANFHTEKVIKESDGAIFWKIASGRGSMPSFKKVLKDEEKWQVISFIRKLQKK